MIQASELRVTAGGLDRPSAHSLLHAYATGMTIRVLVNGESLAEGRNSNVLVVALAGEIDDPELRVAEIPAPDYMPFEHKSLGIFVKTSEALPYAGKAVWRDHEIKIRLDGELAELGLCATQAENLIDRAHLWQAEFEDRIFADLFKLWDEVWREGRQSLSRSEWLGRIILKSISVYASGEFLAYFNDGDLFFGHTIELTGSMAEGAHTARIVG